MISFTTNGIFQLFMLHCNTIALCEVAFRIYAYDLWKALRCFLFIGLRHCCFGATKWVRKLDISLQTSPPSVRSSHMHRLFNCLSFACLQIVLRFQVSNDLRYFGGDWSSTTCKNQHITNIQLLEMKTLHAESYPTLQRKTLCLYPASFCMNKPISVTRDQIITIMDRWSAMKANKWCYSTIYSMVFNHRSLSNQKHFV